MHYPNLLHYDPDYAAEGRWGRLPAPQSFPIAVDDSHGSTPACVGCFFMNRNATVLSRDLIT